MKRWLITVCVLVVAIIAAVADSPSEQSPTAAKRWFKGNTHTHTINSDGDSLPDEVVRWYREHGYHFLILTDHNVLTDVGALNALHGADDQFLVIKGEEVTEAWNGKPLHINGLNVSRRVEPQKGRDVPDILNRNVSAIRDALGVPHINHPNFGWAVTAADLLQVSNNRLLEIYNGHPLVNNLGGGGVPGVEEVWDHLLSAGRIVYGIAVDDAHHFKRPWDPAAAKPGKGWVTVRTDRLEAGSLLEALERGEFYASTGVELEEVSTDGASLSVRVAAAPSSKYRIQFLGKGGRMLSEQPTASARYVFKGDEGYVRAKVWESNGGTAWVQPVFLQSR